MALQGLRRTYDTTGDPAARASQAGVPADPVTAGGTDAAVFGCPSCGRTIPRGSRRCEGCSQRLVSDIPVGKAGRFLGAGLLAGLIVGAGLVFVTAPRQAADAAVGAGAGTQVAGPTPIPADVAATGLAALRGTTTLNGRLAAEAEPLAGLLDARKLDTSAVVKVLRRISADTRAASAMVGALDAWTDASAHQAALAAFYDGLTAELDSGLAVSVTSPGAYEATAKRVLGILAQVPALDAASRALAAEIGADLPPVTFPEVLAGG